MKRTRSLYLMVAAALAVMMLSSAWLGATLALRWQERRSAGLSGPAPARQFLERVDRLQRQLALTDAQRRRVALSLSRARMEVRELAGDSARRAWEIRRRLRAAIEQELTPAQRVELDRLVPIGAGPLERWRKDGAPGAPSPDPQVNP